MNAENINALIRRALSEDAASKDITTNSLIPAMHISKGVIIVREDAVLCGLAIAKKVFLKFVQ